MGSAVLLLFVLTLSNCSNLIKNHTQNQPKNQTSKSKIIAKKIVEVVENHKIYDSMKDEFSNISRNLTKFEEEMNEELNKEMTTDQKEKTMKKFGQKFEKLENKGKYLHGLFHNMAMNGKMKPEDQKDMKKKMNEIKEKFEEIEEMGDEKVEEIKQKKPTTVVPSFTEITRKQHVTEFAQLNQGPPAASGAPNAVKMSHNGEAGEYSMMAGPKRIEERSNYGQDITGKDQEFTMKNLKAHVSEISEKLFSFENEVKGNFMEKNLT